ncbi:MAG: FHA domain-containing protein [Acidobacteria bacterium]|nr:FHA domain-containing protein [Acidobacteriota bacterium]
MQVACSSCGAQHLLNDAQIGDRPRVQFLCTKCGQPTVVEVARRPERTQVITPLPSFARGEGAPGLGETIASEYQGLTLPSGKAITLSVIAGPARGLVYPMTKPRTVLGRSGADVEINDPEVSRWHCAVEVKGDVVRLRDLDSTNGTYFGEERVRAAELRHLSEFRIGSTVVLLTIIPKRTG